MFRRLVFIGLFFVSAPLYAQDYEFPKGWVFNAELSQGLTTRFDGMADLYLGELRLNPSYTVAEHFLRMGIVAALRYNDRALSGNFGPQLAFKIKTLSSSKLGASFMNVQWIVEHLWGTDRQRLLGTGIRFEILQRLLLSLLFHRDYRQHYWDMQMGIGYNFIQPHVPRLHVQ